MENNLRLNAILDGTNIHMWAFDGERYVYMNRAWFEFTGQSPNAELTIDRWTEVLHPEDREAATQIWLQHWNTKTEHNNCFRLRRKDAQYRDFYCHAIPVLDDDGSFMYFQGFNVDITDRKRAEKALLESNEKIRSLVESTRDWVWEIDIEGVHTYSNDALSKSLGYSASDIIGSSAFPLMHPDDRQHWKSKLFECVAKKTGWNNEPIRWIAKSGEIHCFESTATLVRDIKGAVIGFRGIDRDITERKLSEERLRRNEKDLKESQRIAKLGSWRLDLQTNEVQWTEELYRMYGFDPSLPPPPYTEHMKLFTYESWEKLSTSLAKTAKIGMPYELELETVKDEGTNGWLWVHGEAVNDEAGNIIGIWGAAQDITEQKQIENALKESEEKYRLIFEQSPLGIMHFDVNGIIRDCNARFTSIIGAPREKLIGFEMLRHMPEGEAKKAVQDTIEKGEGHFEGIYHTVSGDKSIFIKADHRVITDGNGNIQGAVGIFEDITERKQIEEALNKSEELFRYLVNSAPEGVFVQAKERFLFLNPAMVKIFGAKSAENIIGTDLMARIAPEYHKKIRDRIQAQVESGKPSVLMDQVYLRMDGSSIPVETIAVPIRFRDQDAHLVFVRDISERKAIQDERETQLLFSRALNKISETIISSDEPDHILKISNQIIGETLSVDRTLIYKISFKDDRLTGLCEWLRQPHPDIAPTRGEYPLELFRAPFTEIRKTQKYLVSHCASVGAPFMMDGSGEMLHGHFKIKSLMWYPFAFDQDGFHVFTINQNLQQRQWSGEEIIFLESVAKLVSIALMKIKFLDEQRRMTEEHEKLQKQLLQAQKMESVGRLAGGVAHDFNNMLSVIIGHADIALEEVDPALPIYAELQEIKNAGERSADLTQQLLAFARRQTISPKVIDLNRKIEEIIRMLQRLIGEDIDLAWIPGKNVWPVKVDPSQVNQILANLCVNAKDAIESVGKVTVETDNTMFDESYCNDHPGFIAGDYVALAVSDNGCGMDAVTRSNIFEPFFTTKESGKGTGLGLATVYGVVKQNNGFIDVFSEPGQGTTFKIYLPRHQIKAHLLPEQTKKQQIERGHETILLVEDEPSILRMTTKMLERQGYQVVAAKTPGEAIRLSQEHSGQIDLLITDVVMPEMNGRVLAKNILSIHPHLKRLFMSGYTADIIAHHGVLDDGVNFIQKPFSKHDLSVKLRQILDDTER